MSSTTSPEQIAAERIAEVRRSNGMVLSLVFLALRSLPEAIGNLTQLQQLHLQGNQLTSLPEVIGNLTQLLYLELHGNQSVRGISDVVGFRRSSAWTEYACQTAAAFTAALIRSRLIPL
jgi:hypothetical protein